MAKASHTPLTKYAFGSGKRQEIFQILAEPTFSPIDFNLESLVERKGWGPSDRFRFWFIKERQQLDNPLLEKLVNLEPHILIRKLDAEEDCFCHCEISLNGNVKVYSNDTKYARDFFTDIFTGLPPSFHKPKEWKMRSRWIKDKTSLAFFIGSLQGALGWASEEIPQEIKESINEALQVFETKHYKSCVVMCRRAIESVMKLAYKRFFKEEPKTPREQDFSLYEIIIKFQKKKPDIIPRHLINVLEYVRNLGNIPGAHPKPIPNYRFTRQDAEGALFNTQLFLYSYFTKIDKEIGRVYSLRIDLKQKVHPKEVS